MGWRLCQVPSIARWIPSAKPMNVNSTLTRSQAAATSACIFGFSLADRFAVASVNRARMAWRTSSTRASSTAAATNTSALFGIYRWGWGFLTSQDFNGDIVLIACFASCWTGHMVRRWHADPFGFLRPWNDVPALIGSAPPATPPRPARRGHLSWGSVLDGPHFELSRVCRHDRLDQNRPGHRRDHRRHHRGYGRLCRGAGIEKAVNDALMGHASSDVGDRYGIGYPLKTLGEAIAKIPVPPLQPAASTREVAVTGLMAS
jgi:hypothetical protein